MTQSQTRRSATTTTTTTGPGSGESDGLPAAIARRFALGEVVYRNPLAQQADVENFQLEGQAIVSFPEGRMRLKNAIDPSAGDDANFVY